MIVCVPANFTATTISAVSTADDIARYLRLYWLQRRMRRCARTIDTIIDGSLGTCARATAPVVRIAGPLLFLERPTPSARTYANNAFEMSREMTLIAEATLRGHIGERQPVIAQLFLR